MPRVWMMSVKARLHLFPSLDIYRTVHRHVRECPNCSNIIKHSLAGSDYWITGEVPQSPAVPFHLIQGNISWSASWGLTRHGLWMDVWRQKTFTISCQLLKLVLLDCGEMEEEKMILKAGEVTCWHSRYGRELLGQEGWPFSDRKNMERWRNILHGFLPWHPAVYSCRLSVTTVKENLFLLGLQVVASFN